MVRANNKERARYASEGFVAYLNAKGESSHEANLRDFVGDLRHCCQINEKAFDLALLMAQRHFQAECHD